MRVFSSIPRSRLFLGLAGASLALLAAIWSLRITETPLILASLGGSCVILFGMPESYMATPRSLFGGHLIGTICGLLCLNILGSAEWVMALSVGLALAVMMLTDTIHSPAGANPLIVIWSGADWSFLIKPLLMGVVVIFLAQVIWARAVQRWLQV